MMLMHLHKVLTSSVCFYPFEAPEKQTKLMSTKFQKVSNELGHIENSKTTGQTIRDHASPKFSGDVTYPSRRSRAMF